MIFKNKTQLNRSWNIEERKAEIIGLAGGDEATVESVLNVLLGTRYNDYEDNQYFVYSYDEEETETKWWQRLNRIWFVVVFILFIMPVQWVTKGQIGIKENSKFGRFLLKLIGED